MFTVTIIRLESKTFVFENTETNTTLFSGQIENELTKRNVDTDKIQSVLNMKFGDRMTIEKEENGKLWFMYIHRVSK
jgi:hypothetical protein